MVYFTALSRITFYDFYLRTVKTHSCSIDGPSRPGSFSGFREVSKAKMAYGITGYSSVPIILLCIVVGYSPQGKS
jgi:hypothetical protein